MLERPLSQNTNARNRLPTALDSRKLNFRLQSEPACGRGFEHLPSREAAQD